MHEYGTTREQLAEVAVAARAWAGLNPEAFVRDPLTIEDVLSARPISDPFTVRDCCLVTDGGGAIVVQELAAALQERAGIAELVVSEHDILDGIALSLG